MNLNNYITTSSSPDFANAVFGLAIVTFICFLTIVIVLELLEIIGLWKSFKKAGKPGWAAIIPFYNIYVLIKTAKMNWWHFLIFTPLLIIVVLFNDKIIKVPDAFVNLAILSVLIYWFVINLNFVKAYKKGVGFAIICTFLPFIGYMIIGCGSAKYEN